MTRKIVPECGAGWDSLINPLIDQCAREGIHIDQIKEKFGTLRFYISGVPPGSTIEKNIDAAEEASAAMCEVCGSPGTLGGKFWMRTRCAKHQKEMR